MAVINENQLELLLQKRLCRFCMRQGTATSPFIAACTCQGPNASIHRACLEEYLGNNPKKRRCDVCCYVYKTEVYEQSLLEWLTFLYSSEHDWNRSELPKLVELTGRGLSVAWMVVFSGALVHYTKPLDVEEQPYRAILQTVLGRFTLAFGLLRIIALLHGIYLSVCIGLDEFATWRAEHPKVKVEPISTEKPAKRSPVDRSTLRASGMKASHLSKLATLVAHKTTEVKKEQ